MKPSTSTRKREYAFAKTTVEDFESDDSEEDDEHPLTRDELHAKTMRGLAKREASAGKRAAPKTAPKARGR